RFSPDWSPDVCPPHLTPPVSFLPHAATGRAIGITHFRDGYFVAWKGAGSTGGIYACFLGRHQDTAFTRQEAQVPGAGSSMGPVGSGARRVGEEASCRV